MEGSGIFSNGEVNVLPHVNAAIVGAWHVKIDVNSIGVEAGGVPVNVKVFASGDVLVHGRCFVEAASLASCGSGVR